MIVSIWLVLNFLRNDKGSKQAPVHHKIWSDDGLPINPLVAQAIRSI